MAKVTQLHRNREQEPPRGAVSNHTYNIVSMFQSKLEALAAYDTYLPDLQDDDEARQLVEQIRDDDARHVQALRDHIEQMCRAGSFR